MEFHINNKNWKRPFFPPDFIKTNYTGTIVVLINFDYYECIFPLSIFLLFIVMALRGGRYMN
jgi:hypothetical protein